LFQLISFHVGLLVITLSSIKLHTENNAVECCKSSYDLFSDN